MAVKGLFAQSPTVRPRDLYLEKSADSPGKPSGHHLGLRYTVLLVDPATRSAREADPDKVFHEGDCLAIEFTPNYGGNLYAFNHGSSGAWQLLLPSPQMPAETGFVKAGEVRRVPADYCFRLDDKPGAETLVLAITEKPGDSAQLRALLVKPPAPAVAVATAGDATPAAQLIGDLMDSWQRLASRDLRLEKIRQPEFAGERPNSVYAVNSSAADSGRLVVEIEIRHE
jgi:hypothetical protein